MVYNVWLIWLEDEISMIKSEKSYELEEAENSSSFMEEVKRMNTPYNGNCIN